MKFYFPRALCFAALVLFASASLAGTAHAEFRPDGSLMPNMLLSSPDVGASVMVDLWGSASWFHVGGALGVAFAPSDDANESRVFMPVALSVAGIFPLTGPLGFDIRARGGVWGGGSNDGLVAGPMTTVGANLHLWLDSQVALSAGFSAWFLFGNGDATYLSPAIGLTWDFNEP